MLRKSIYKSTALTLAFLIFFTSVGFSIDIHSCKGELKGISFLGEAKSCHTITKSCPNHGSMKVMTDKDEQRNCCTNQSFEFDELDSDYNLSQDIVFSDLELKFLTSFIYSFFINDAPSTTEIESFISPSPPIVKDIYVLNETFLI